MSDKIKHECGIALIRLRKPMQYYIDKYGTPTWAINKLYLLMQKQHNRGQDGAGAVNIKIDQKPGKKFITRYRSAASQPIMDIFGKVNKKLEKVRNDNPEKYMNAKWLKSNLPFMGELYLGHLRYGTHGKNGEEYCHPMIRRNNWKSRNLIMAGNFNMTNVDELFNNLVELGQHPIEKIDTVTVLEKIGHFLDEENQALFRKYKNLGFSNTIITEKVSAELNIQNILIRSCKDFDGGYAMAGLTGFGAAFVARDPAGIRPAYFYADDEVVVVASEKPAIKTTFNIEYNQIQEIEPGNALIINKDGKFGQHAYIKRLPKKSCSFERIYFSRGSDPEIYEERKQLGELLIPQIMEELKYNFENTVFSYIPNTAEISFLGMTKGIDDHFMKERLSAIKKGLNDKELEKVLSFRPRIEKLVIKDVKLRTFITDDEGRNDLVTHVYDTTYEVIEKNKDTIVVIDDSIVRGTTLEKSIINMLDRLEPKKIIVVSSAPQIRYPDCYGIDMSRMSDFVAFRAAMSLIKKTGQEKLLNEVYEKCKASLKHGNSDVENHVKEVYAPFSDEEISNEVAEIIKQDHIKADISVIFQKVENLHKACPHHKGDWYFTGDYPTPGGNRVVNKSFMYYMDGKVKRAY
ncbi:MAG: amidophosphoribosyltransferase [Flammeovirgaceae bacterium]|nr:amidophosphoribosyltransferase [Flammeovirgaceae bacterium]